MKPVILRLPAPTVKALAGLILRARGAAQRGREQPSSLVGSAMATTAGDAEYCDSNIAPHRRLRRMQQEVVDLLHGCGLANDGSERSRYWEEWEAAVPSHTEMVERLEAALNEMDPIAAARRDDEVGMRLSPMLRNRWLSRWKRRGRAEEPSLRTVRWEDLDVQEREEVTIMLLDIQDYQQSFIRRGAPRKGPIDTALDDLAILFLRLIGSDRGPIELPYAETSQFIQFAHLALSAADPKLTPRAVSRRWARRIMRMRSAEAWLDEPDEDADA